MMTFTDYVPNEEDIDKVKLGIVKLLFDNGFRLDSAHMVNELTGAKQIKIVLKPKITGDSDEKYG